MKVVNVSRGTVNRTTPTRPWRGTSALERQTKRRGQLLEAGLEVIGSRGWANATVVAVCREAGLTERYFYEAFGDRKTLLLEVYAAVRDEAVNAVVGAFLGTKGDLRARTRASIAAAFHVLFDDPRKGKLLLLEAATDESLLRVRRELLTESAALLAEITKGTYGGRELDPVELRLSTLALLGAITELGTAYVSGTLDVSRERLLEHVTNHFFMVLSEAGVRSANVLG